MDKKFLTEVILLTKTYNLQDFKDWLNWHLNNIKFDHCHIFDNESFVDIKSVCDSYSDKVSYEKIIGWPNQYSLYGKYINNKSKAWWVLPIDDDEFLWMKNFNNVNDMILYYQSKWPDMCKLSIRWKNMFPTDPQADRGNKSLMEFCTKSNETWASFFEGGNRPVKTFVKTTKSWNHTCFDGHNPDKSIYSYLCNGERLNEGHYRGPETDNDLKILHFQYKSKKEWINKCRTRFDAANASRRFYVSKYENIVDKLK